MSALGYLMAVLLDSFNAISFTLLAALSLRHFGKRRTHWGGFVYVWLAAALAVNFGTHVLIPVFQPFLGSAALRIAGVVTDSFIPALLLHLFYRNEKGSLPGERLWGLAVGVFYFAAAGLAVVWSAVQLGLLPGAPAIWAVHKALLALAALLAGAATLLSHRVPGRLERRQRRWLMALCGALAAVFLLRLVSGSEWLRLPEKLVPLGFAFAVTYYVERFTFFDVLIKQGAPAFLSLLGLTLYFSLLAPWMLRRPVRGLAFPLSVWPLMLAYPWCCRKISAWIDRRWLGRRYSPAEAARYFLGGLRGALTEADLAGLAERLLREIFRAEAEVELKTGAPCETPDEVIRAPIRLGGEPAGEMRLRAQARSRRFLSEDAALLASLAEGFSFLWENLRLRETRLRQEKREQELILNANRAELKALRAQINPHFLFNALNTIAGLIPRFPERAERTIEQLAEVFRFTLRRSHHEWVRVGEELEAVRAYLDVEQARFGQRLHFQIECDEETAALPIPAMLVQTLVENAVKHGIGAVSRPGIIEVRAGADGERLSISVADNGPGFEENGGQDGYGLRNVRERLEGHFGPVARLRVEREAGMTRVGLEMPLTRKAAS